MKKFFAVTAVILALFAFAGCKSQKQKLYIYNWTYYMPDEILKDFEKKYNVEVVYDQFASNEEMFTKIKAGGTGYDITFPSGDYVSIMIKEGMLEKIDKSKLANFKNLNPVVLAKINYDKGNEYSVPYMIGATGIAVNKKFIKNYSKKDLSIYLDASLKGKMLLLDDMREVLGFALKSLGYSVNTRNPKELEEAKKLVLKWKPNLLKFDAESFAKSFAAGEVNVVHTYADALNIELNNDPELKKNVDFFIPECGGPMYMDSMVILKGAKNIELAHKFIDFVLEPENAVKIINLTTVVSPNGAGTDMYNKLLADPATANQYKKQSYTLDDLKNCEFKEDLGDALPMYDKIWQEIRFGS